MSTTQTPEDAAYERRYRPDLTTRTRRVIAESDGGGSWLVMWPDGGVQWFPTKASVLRAVKDTATEFDIDIATVEWRNP